MRASLARAVYRFSLTVSGALFWLSLRIHTEAVGALLYEDTGDRMDSVVENLVRLGEARRLIGKDL